MRNLFFLAFKIKLSPIAATDNEANWCRQVMTLCKIIISLYSQ